MKRTVKMLALLLILSLLAAENLPCVILKGSSSAMNYPKPELRCSGDIDLYFSPDEINRAQALLTAQGYVLSEGNDSTGGHRAMHRGPFIVELHHAPSGLPDSPVGDAIRAYFLGAERIPMLVNGLPTLPADRRAVLLLAHKLEHVMTSGLGLRQLCDWAVFVAKELSPQLWTELSPTLSRFGLFYFCRIVTRTCVEYLGLPAERAAWCMDASAETSRALMEDMLSSGNFGHKENRYGQRLFTNIEAKGRISSFFRTGIAVCREHWPVCERYPLLLPIAPAVLLARYRRQRKDGLRPALRPVIVYQGAAARQKLYKELRPFVAEDE